MENLSTQIVMKALDGLTARSIMTAHNIANVNTAGFQPLRLNFEEALASAANRGAAAVNAVQAEVAETLTGGVRLDLEMATASATSLRYAALIDLLGRQLQMESVAVSGGR